MSILTDFINKYDGELSPKSFNTASGESGYHDLVEKGRLIYKGLEVNIWWNGGEGDPLRIVSNFNGLIKEGFLIYPRTYFGQVFSVFIPNWKYSFPKEIHSQYKIDGNVNFIKSIRSNQELLDSLNDSNVCIQMKKNSDRLMLTPLKGFDNLKSLEVLVQILFLIHQSLEAGFAEN